MQRSLINYNKINSNRSNIYVTETRDGNYNIPQEFNCPCSIENDYYICKITDNKLEGCNNFGLTITLPEIKGIGTVRYQTNFVYKLIEEFIIETIDNDTNIILKKTGLEFLFDFIKQEHNYINIIGNNQNYCIFKTGKFSDDIIFNTCEIYIPLITIFDNSSMNPRTCLRLYPETKLQIRIKFRPFKDILIYDIKYRKNSLKNIQDVDLQPYIKFLGYNTCSDEFRNRYIEELVTSTHQSNKKNYYTPEFSSITNILWYTKSDIFNNKQFISYPNYPETEESFIDSYVNRILEDLIIVDCNLDFIKKRQFSETCKFLKLKSYDEISFDVNNVCIINITNIPEGYDVYYHTNILSFNRRNSTNEYNISKKFKYILGEYLLDEDRIIFRDIKHNITIHDVSIPIEIWNAEENTSTKDLRSKKSKQKDIIINDPYIFGLDLLSKESGIFTRSLKSSSNETICDVNSDTVNLAYYFNCDNLYPITTITNSSYPSIFLYRFNIHNILFAEPSRLLADIEKNFRCVNITIDWKEFPDMDPRSLFPKKLIICITPIKKIIYDNNIITTQILDAK
ncbi:rifampicin resistance protein [Alphaentomopoxvirus acuprea]|uniref:62 kDa protein n=1 Tax=Alphaentomopoxvirus acuprea TaxID=62099 RepID=W6JIX4_9POXV|nr:rifampicin resistance protein [Anomala cuprea entomopoxvirus]BAO49553.1 rifampicin resistance protein [Anomala cuprea entomopoxvirus]